MLGMTGLRVKGLGVHGWSTVMDLCLNISVQGMQRRGSDGHRLFVAWRPNGVTGKLPKWVALRS